MATRLYLTADDAFYTPATVRGSWSQTASATVQHLGRTKRSNTSAQALAETNATNPWNRLLARFVSDRLAAQTISGNLTFTLLARESNATANMTARVYAYVTQGDTDTPRGTIIAANINSTEFQVDAANHGGIQFSLPLSSLAVSDGDRIVIEVGYSAANGDTTSYTGSIKIGGRDTDATGAETAETSSGTVCPWVEFDGNLGFLDTYLYLTSSAAPVATAANRGTWDVAGSAVERKLEDGITSAARTSLAVAETSGTNPTDVLLARFVSDTIDAQTISGTIWVNWWQIESAAAADAFGKIHAYVMAPDGSVRGTLLSNQIGGTELSTALTNRFDTFTMTNVTAQRGDRIVVEIGARFTNAVATSYTSTLYYGGSGTTYEQAQGGFTTGEGLPWVQVRYPVTWWTQQATARSFTASTIG